MTVNDPNRTRSKMLLLPLANHAFAREGLKHPTARAARPAQGLPGGRVGALQKEEAARRVRSVLTSIFLYEVDHERDGA